MDKIITVNEYEPSSYGFHGMSWEVIMEKNNIKWEEFWSLGYE